MTQVNGQDDIDLEKNEENNMNGTLRPLQVKESGLELAL